MKLGIIIFFVICSLLMLLFMHCALKVSSECSRLEEERNLKNSTNSK